MTTPIARCASLDGGIAAACSREEDQEQYAQDTYQQPAYYQPPPAYQQPPPPPPPPPPDPIAQLKDLAELKNQGILTEAEFEAQKARILGS